MKRPPSAMSTTLWVIGGPLAAYIVGGVIFYYELRYGIGLVGYLPESVLNFLLMIYGLVFLLLGNIWPEHFPFFH